MELKFDVTGTQRKEMVSIISDTVHMKAIYKFMPTCAYVIDNMTVSKEGTLLWDERTSQETIDAVLAALTAAGFSYEGEKQEPEQPAADESGLTVSLPRDGFSDMALENMNRLLDAKGTLIKKALDIEALPLEVTDERVSFPWFHRDLTPDEVQTYMSFIANLCAMAKNAKRITATEKPVDNEKYAFRCFLLRLGFIGSEYKTQRKILLRNLTGSSAFRSGTKKGWRMMRFPSKAVVEVLRRKYPVGTRVELVRMDDPQAPPIGTKGTVRGVDDIGSIMVAWDNGCGLSVAYGADICRKVGDADAQ